MRRGKKANIASCKGYAGNQHMVIMESQANCDFCKAEHLGAHYKVCVIEEPVAKMKSAIFGTEY